MAQDMARGWNAQKYPGMAPTISIQQPFAEAILAGVKSIELRSWATPYRGWLLLHAGKRWYGQDGNAKQDALLAEKAARLTIQRLGLSESTPTYPFGAIVGIAYLTRCARFTEESWYQMADQHRSNAPWDSHDGRYSSDVGWKFTPESIRRLDQPLPYRGALGIFPAPLKILPDAMQELFTAQEAMR